MGLKFKVGDKVTVVENGQKATVLGTSFNSVYQYYEYTVRWDHDLRTCSYPADDVESIWELECPAIKTARARVLVDGVEVGFASDVSFTFPQECDHDWADYHGFSTSYKFCKKCDEKRAYEN